MKKIMPFILAGLVLSSSYANSCVEKYEQIQKNDEYTPMVLKKAVSGSAGALGGFLTFIAASFASAGAPIIIAGVGALVSERVAYDRIFGESGPAYTQVLKLAEFAEKSAIGKDLVQSYMDEGMTEEEAILEVEKIADITTELMESKALCNGEVTGYGKRVYVIKKGHKGQKVKRSKITKDKTANIVHLLKYIKENDL